MSDDLTKTLSQILEECFEEKLDSGYQIIDRNSALSLRKQAMTELKLKKGNWTYTGKALEKVMEKRGIKVPDDMQAKLIDEMKIKLFKSEVPIPQVPALEPESPFGTLPTPEGSTQPQATASQVPPQLKEIKIVTDEMAQSWERGLANAFGMLTRFYAKTGLIEVEGIKPKEKRTLKDYTDETELLAHDLAMYCKENNVHLPKSFELSMLLLESGMILGSPLFKLFNFGKKGKKTEDVKDLEKDNEKGTGDEKHDKD